MPPKFLDTASTTPTTNGAITPVTVSVTSYLDLEDDDSNDEDKEGFIPSIMRARLY